MRIFLRPLGSPLTLGMSGLAVVSLLQSGVDLRWLAPAQTPEVGAITLTLPVVLPLLACVFAYLARDAPSGAAMAIVSTSWLALGLAQTTSSPGAASGALGLLLVGAAAVLSLSAIAVSIAKPLPGLVFLLAAARFALTGAFHLSADRGAQEAAGIVGLVVLALAAYAATAFELEDQRHAVLPTFRRARARAAIAGEPAQAIDDAVHEAGVRQTI